MIALSSGLPLLRVGSCELSTYGPEWVAECIHTAARVAGHTNWWFAEDIARSLIVYLRNRFPGSAITLQEMTERIQHTLKRIGFTDISAHIRLTPPALRLSLNDLAREAEGFELRFFQLLDARLTELKGLGARRIEITASREGVKHLCAARHWSQACKMLTIDIAHFIALREATGENRCAIELEAA
jgi:hypothetical protein